MKKKIVIGTTDIAGHIEDYRIGYEANSCSVKTIVYGKTKRFEHCNYDFIIGNVLSPVQKKSLTNLPYRILRLIIISIYKYLAFFYLCLNAEVFHAIWPAKFVKWRWFIPLVKILNPSLKIVFTPSGDDIRWRPANIQEYNRLGFHLHSAFIERSREATYKDLKEKLELLRTFEQYADIIYSQPNQSQMALRPYKHYNLPIQINKINFRIPNNRVPVIIHVATEKAVKSTAFVDAIIKQLEQNNITHEFRLFENMQNKLLLQELSKADIVIYDPYGTATGKFGLEAIFCGCLLLTGYKKGYQPFPPDIPLPDITPDNIYDALVYYISNPVEREEKTKQQYNWAIKYFDNKEVCKRILEDLSLFENNELQYDYYPNFLRDFYTPLFLKEETDLINQYTRKVMHCTWYKNSIKPGTREGLIFND